MEADLRTVIVSARWSGAVVSALLAYMTTIIATRLFYSKTLRILIVQKRKMSGPKISPLVFVNEVCGRRRRRSAVIYCQPLSPAAATGSDRSPAAMAIAL